MEYQLINPINKEYTVMEQILTNRGLSFNSIGHYLNTTDDDIYSPSLLDNMKLGAQMLIKHISQGDTVLVIIDSDADGYTSSALLLNYLYCLFPDFVQTKIKYHIHTGKQHGLADMMERITEDIKLVICPDAASSDVEEHQILFEKGIDVLVLDHHEFDTKTEYACVINNQDGSYPNQTLSGVGVTYKFCCFIDSLLNKNIADNYLDLVALGIIADVMDLRNFETKRLIEKGLKKVLNPFFKGMLERNAFSIGDELTPIGVAFYIAPYINAVVRVGSQEEKLTLFESMLDYRGYELIPSTKRGCKGQVETRVEQACRSCTNIKKRQTTARDASLNIIETIIEDQKLLDNKLLVVKLGANQAVEKTLTGLVANVLMDKYQRPVLILNQTTHYNVDETTGEILSEETWWEGSGRGYDKSKLDDFRQFLQETELVEYAEG